MGNYQVLTLQVRGALGVLARNGLFKLPKFLELAPKH